MPSGNSQPDGYFIAAVRRIARDQPVWFNNNLPTDNSTGVINVAGRKPFRLDRAPIVAGSVTLTAPGGGYVVDYDDIPATPAAGHVNIVTASGEVIFATAPGVGTLAVSYQATKFSDTQILDALTQGLNMLWPEIWIPTIDTTTIALSPTVFEYSLPLAFRDQRVTLLEVEYQPPSGIVRSYKTGMWRIRNDVVNPQLIFTAKRPPGGGIGTLVLQYATVLNELGAVPSLAMFLPVYYAVARILMDQEVMRARADDLPAMTGEAAQAPQNAMQTAVYWMQQFERELVKVALEPPVRRTVMGRAVERLGLSEFWQSAA